MSSAEGNLNESIISCTPRSRAHCDQKTISPGTRTVKQYRTNVFGLVPREIDTEFQAGMRLDRKASYQLLLTPKDHL